MNSPAGSMLLTLTHALLLLPVHKVSPLLQSLLGLLDQLNAVNRCFMRHDKVNTSMSILCMIAQVLNFSYC